MSLYCSNISRLIPQSLIYSGARMGFSSSACLLSGHNKWSTIKHDKAKNDAARNKLQLKISNQILLAVRLNGGQTDPSINFRLQSAIDVANRNSIPKKVIESAIKRGSGQGSGAGDEVVESITYEGMGPGGVAFVVETATGNRNRTVGVVKSTFAKAGGMLAPTKYLFARRGWVEVDVKEGQSGADDAFEQVVDLGAEDLEELPADAEEGTGVGIAVYTEPQDTARLGQALKENGYKIRDMGIEYAPNEDTAVNSLDDAQKVAYEKLCAALDDLDDVVDIYTNYTP